MVGVWCSSFVGGGQTGYRPPWSLIAATHTHSTSPLTTHLPLHPPIYNNNHHNQQALAPTHPSIHPYTTTTTTNRHRPLLRRRHRLHCLRHAGGDGRRQRAPVRFAFLLCGVFFLECVGGCWVGVIPPPYPLNAAPPPPSLSHTHNSHKPHQPKQHTKTTQRPLPPPRRARLAQAHALRQILVAHGGAVGGR